MISALKKEKIIHLDLHEFCQVESGMTVRDVIDKMRHERFNCALVMKKGDLIGIFTDRDVLRKVAAEPSTWDQPIDEFMTPNPDTINPQDAANHALNIMGKSHFRNIPVVDEEGKIHGNVTYYAFIKYLADRYPQEVYNLPPDDTISEDRYGG